MIIGVIGSHAMNLWLDNMKDLREPQDLDIVASYDDIKTFVAFIKSSGVKVFADYPISSGKKVLIKTNRGIIEAEVAWPGSSGEALLDLIMAETREEQPVHYGVPMLAPSLDLLYMLKMSHRYLKNSPHFLKTMQDIKLMRRLGAVIRPEHEKFYKERMAWTYTYAHPKLNTSKGEFFTDDVPYIYDHDSIHETVKHLAKPAYSYFKPDESDVMVSREMFEALPEYTKLCSVLEEVYVLALERSQIPYPTTDKKRSFDMAHMKVCTSITSGWWREYAWENYARVQDMYNEQYVYHFWTAVGYGDVKMHKQPTQGEF
jgi:hypothetical protein